MDKVLDSTNPDGLSGMNDEALLGQRLADISEKAGISLCLFPHNADAPGSDASLARMFFRHLPTVASYDEGTPSSRATIMAWEPRLISRALSQDLEQGRDIIEWLGPHVSPEISSMFAKGEQSSLNAVFDRIAKEGGFVRDDILVKEAAGSGSTSLEVRRAQSVAAAQLLGLQR